MEIEVKGHSGCKIDIVRENSDLFIYKSSTDPLYFVRLIKQAEKQKQAYNWEYQHVRIPQIYHIKSNDKHVEIKMEYVYSKNFVEYFESAGFEQISYFVKALILFIEKELKSCEMIELSSDVIKNKFEDVMLKIESNNNISSNKKISDIVQKSKDIFEHLDRIKIPVGLCHGDLTFSNMLFNGNNYYLIDFLDSFVESPLLDIVKIRQDSAYLWSQLMYVREFDELRLKIISDKIDNEIHSYFSRYEWYSKNYQIFQLMNFLRIIQYANDDKIIDYLIKTINNIIDEF